MKVRRIYEKEVKSFKKGDQIQVGKYTASAVGFRGKATIFLLDQYLDKPYDHHDLIKKLNRDLSKDKNFDEVRSYLVKQYVGSDNMPREFRVPFAGEIFNGTEEEKYLEYYEPDTEKDGRFLAGWDCMKDRKNRIAMRKGDPYEWGWLMNRVKNSASGFASVSYAGYAGYLGASAAHGVRPVFLLELKQS